MPPRCPAFVPVSATRRGRSVATDRGHTDAREGTRARRRRLRQTDGVTGPLRGPRRPRGPTILLLPTWTIVHKRFWKAQVPYLSRHFRVVTYDGPGNGRSDRPLDPAAYEHDAQVAYALAVLDATGTDRAVVVGLSLGGCRALQLAAEHADRVLGSVLDRRHRPAARPRAGRAAGRRRRGAPGPSGCPCSGATPSSTGRSTAADYWHRAPRGLPLVLLRHVLPRAALDAADRGRRRLGPGHDPGRADRRAAGAPWPSRETRGVVRRDHQPRPGDPRRPRPDQPARAAASASPSSPAASSSPSRAAATSRSPATRSRSTSDPRLRRAVRTDAAAHVDPVAGAVPRRSSTSPRRSASATPAATSRSPGRSGSGTRTSRSTGSPSTRSPGCSRAPASGSTRPAAGSPASPGTSRRSPASTTCTASRPCGAWTSCSSATSWSSTTSCARSTTTSSSATRPGRSTTSCTRTRSSSGSAYAWLTDFVGFLPMPDDDERAGSSPPTTTPR